MAGSKWAVTTVGQLCTDSIYQFGNVFAANGGLVGLKEANSGG